VLRQLLLEDTPAKVGGAPGDAFDLVYTTVAEPVRRKVHSADPALGQWIQLHLYGDVYSSPGLDLRRKQLLMCARLAQADMGEQLFGHALAVSSMALARRTSHMPGILLHVMMLMCLIASLQAMRFGCSRDQLLAAVNIAFEIAHGGDAKVHAEAVKMLDMVREHANKRMRLDLPRQGLLINRKSPCWESSSCLMRHSLCCHADSIQVSERFRNITALYSRNHCS